MKIYINCKDCKTQVQNFDALSFSRFMSANSFWRNEFWFQTELKNLNSSLNNLKKITDKSLKSRGNIWSKSDKTFVKNNVLIFQS